MGLLNLLQSALAQSLSFSLCWLLGRVEHILKCRLFKSKGLLQVCFVK
jgi:hypothetical protein